MPRTEPTVEDWDELFEWDEMMYPREEDRLNEQGQVDEHEEYGRSSSSPYGPCAHWAEEPHFDPSEEDENFPD
jgi:hypothetical protein